MNYGITMSELHQSLKEYIDNSRAVNFMKSSTTLSSSTNEVLINIGTFNKNKDLLLVYKDSVYLEETEDYTISSDNKKIISTDGNYSSGTIFNFIVLANCAATSDNLIDGTKLLPNSVSLEKLDTQLSDILNNIVNNNIDGGIF